MLSLAIFKRPPRVALIRLTGLIAARPGASGVLSLEAVGPLLDRAFGLKRLAAVFLVINSPGGSAVQSSLIGQRIRRLADEKQIPVIACVEDAAASGGYWIACAADEIVVDRASIVGSIGVISAGFGFTEAIARLGVERRVTTAGTEKALLDPFRPVDPVDQARLETLLEDLHEEFRGWVRERRGDRLRGAEAELFSGRFWIGRTAIALGLADRLGDAEGEARRRFGDKVRIERMGPRRPGFFRRLIPRFAAGIALAAEERAAWGRLGL